MGYVKGNELWERHESKHVNSKYVWIISISVYNYMTSYDLLSRISFKWRHVRLAKVYLFQINLFISLDVFYKTFKWGYGY